MIYGIPPFYNQNQNMMFQLIRDSEVRFPVKPETSPESKDLILKVFIIYPINKIYIYFLNKYFFSI